MVSSPESLAVGDGGPDVPSNVVMASSVQTLHLGMVFVYNNHCDTAASVELETIDFTITEIQRMPLLGPSPG